MFINRVSADKVTLKFAPHEYPLNNNRAGVVVKHPIVVEYSVGQNTRFKFFLSPGGDEDVSM